jgi:hypothetical protein
VRCSLSRCAAADGRDGDDDDDNDGAICFHAFMLSPSVIFTTLRSARCAAADGDDDDDNDDECLRSVQSPRQDH